MESARYLVGVLVVTFMPPGLLWWFLIHPFVDFWRRVGAGITLTIMGVLGVGGVAGLMLVRDALLGPEVGAPLSALVAAGLLLGLQIYLAIRRKRHLTLRILVGLPELSTGDESGELLTKGIYGVIRHPRYVEIAAGTLAMALFSGYLGALVVAFATLPVLHLIVLLEERELRVRFGDAYDAYEARVPRYLPLRRPRTR